MTKDFYDSLKLGNIGEKNFEAWMTQHPQVKQFKKLNHINDFLDKDFEYDYLIEDHHGRTLTVEIKCLAGAKDKRAYTNAVIEVWKDDKKTKRPGWFKASEANALNYLIFFNRHNSTFYIYNATELYRWAKKQQVFTFANNGNKDNPGWIAMLSWEEYGAGYLGKQKWKTK